MKVICQGKSVAPKELKKWGKQWADAHVSYGHPIRATILERGGK